jgi:CO dehydrogenase/acetyl-CoA synthase beta subunit
MNTNDKRIKHLKMMGYEVRINDRFNYIDVVLKTNKKYVCYVRVTAEDLYQDFVIEEIVKKLNEMIVRDL